MSDAVMHAEEHHPHHPFLQHHFEDMAQQHEASTLGMWMFLATEILFFGGILAAYAIYRIAYPAAWAEGAHHQNVLVGTINTAVLLGSSFTMARPSPSSPHGSTSARSTPPIAIAIASIKAALVILFFMHAPQIGVISPAVERRLMGIAC